MNLLEMLFIAFTCRANHSDGSTRLPSTHSLPAASDSLGKCASSSMQAGYRWTQKKKEDLAAGPPYYVPWSVFQREAKKKLAGWVARTRPLAEPLSPRGPQPVLRSLRTPIARLNGSAEPLDGVLE